MTTLSGPIPTLPLTPEQDASWGNTMSLMGWSAPGFRHLFYRLLCNHGDTSLPIFTDLIPTAATDGKNILCNPDFMFGMTLKERVFVLAHEVVHNVYGDVDFLNRCKESGTVPQANGTTLSFKELAMQHAMDYRINALLRDSRIGTPPKGVLLDDAHKAEDSVIDVYGRIWGDYPDDGGGPGGGFDTVLKPGTSTGQSPTQAKQNQQQWAHEVSVARTIEQMKSQGDMAGALKRMFAAILEPIVPWTEKIRTIANRKLGSHTYNWRKPDRRFIVRDLYLPSRSGFGAGWVVFWGDTSGSIGAGELDRYMGELSGIIEDVKPRRLTGLWCDAKIHKVTELEDADDLLRVRAEGVGGGGGTSVKPVFDWITENAHEPPDMFIGFTDLHVSMPDTVPTFPCIWACTTDKVAPFGDTVKINAK